MTRAKTLLPILLLLWLVQAPSLSGYPPPAPSASPHPLPPEEAWTSETQGEVAEASDLYFRGIRAYLEGNLDLAAFCFESALDLIRPPHSEAETVLPDTLDLLWRKAAYLLSKVSRNGEYETTWTEAPRPLVPPPEPKGTLPGLTVVSNEHTDRWLRYFTEDARDRFSLYLERMGRYEAIMRRILCEHGLPEELVYLPLIESGFNPRAYSAAHAAGIWQFIRSTGGLYGLEVDYWVDERRDPEKSCEAAARHLRHLWEVFESWPLVLAAYNAGEKRVMDAILSGGTRDFWRLRLPRQTRDYVPRFMAAIMIARDPASYGFTVRYDPPLAYDVLEVDQPTDLELVARCCSSTPDFLKDLNPELRRGATPPGKHRHPVRIPAGSLSHCTENLFKIPKDDRLASQSQFTVHRVRRGETLSHIATRYGTTVSEVATANNLKSTHFIREGQTLTVPTPGGYVPSPETVFRGDEWREEGDKIVYVVRRGDTLDAIARAYKTRVDYLRRWNGLGKDHYIIHPGDRLLIFVPGES